MSNWSETIISHGLTQLVKSATCVTDNSATIIDHIYTSEAEKICDVSKLNISDHYPVCCTRFLNNKNA